MLRHLGGPLEILDNRLKRIEQRLSSIEKFIAENYTKGRPVDRILAKVTENKGLSPEAGPAGEQSPAEAPVKDYHYNYAASTDLANQPKATLHFVDTSVFKNQKVITVTDDTFTVFLFGVFIIFVIYFGGRFVIDGNWLTPTSQTSLAALMGIAFMGLGFVLTNTMEKYAKYFPIVGSVILYITAFGAAGFYGIIPRDASLVAVFLVSAACVLMSRKFQLDVYQIIAVVGAYVSPLYITYEGSSDFVNFYYLGISFFFMVMAVIYDLTVLPALGAFFSLAVCAISEYIDNDVMNLVLFTLGHFVFYASAYTLKAVRSSEDVNKAYAYSFFPFVLLFYFTEYYYIYSFKTMLTPAFTAITSALLGLSYLCVKQFSKKGKNDLTSSLLLSLASLTAIHTIFYVLVPEKFRPLSLIVAAVLSIKGIEKLTEDKWKLYSRIMAYSLVGLIGLNYFEVIFTQFSVKALLPVINGLIYASVLVYVTFFEKKILEVNVNPLVSAGAAHIILLSAIYNMTKSSGSSIWIMATGGYFLVAIASLVFLEKIQNKINQ